MEEVLITPREAAALKGVSRGTVYKAIAEGKLPHSLQLGHIALKKSDVLAWKPGTRGGAYNTRPMSEAAKEKLSRSQKVRWSERKEANEH